jgi:superfamily II DNA or RNA helicase
VTADAPRALALSLSPSGSLHLDEPADEPATVEAGVAARLSAAFALGAGHGLLQLGAAENTATLPASLAYFRELGRLFVVRLCALPDVEAQRANAAPAAPDAELAQLAAAPPAMVGAEYVSTAALAALWAQLQRAFHEEMAATAGTVQDFLQARSRVWNTLGRVHFHLAENKRDPAAPFAFLATYASGLTPDGRPRHLPLGKALTEYGGADDRQALLSLLLPVQRAAEKSPFLRALVEGGDIFHPLAWGPADAYRFLREVDAFEQAGVLVRLPDWWHRRAPPRPIVRVTVGKGKPRGLGAAALTDFSVAVVVDGEPLGAQELKRLLAASDGLVLLKGKWVEVDRQKLSDVLDRWKRMERDAASGRLSFHDALRLSAGFGGAGALAEGAIDGDVAAWSRVEAGPWLAQTLASLRAPDALPAEAGVPGLVATLRPYQQVGLRWLGFVTGLRLGACLADDMGLGKTLQVLALLLHRKQLGLGGTSLLVVPASLLANWKSEAARFTPALRVLVAHPSAGVDLAKPPALAELDAVVTTYGSVLRAPWVLEHAWSLVVLDEAQAIKNPDAKQTRAVKSLRAEARLALTGTPVENRLADLWSLFDFLSPGLLGSAAAFRSLERRLVDGGPAAYAPLRALVRPYILRRLKTDPGVAPDLPPKTEVKTFCSLSRSQAALYQQAVTELEAALGDVGVDGMARRGVVLAFLTRFKQICNHPAQWLGTGDYDGRESGKMTRLAGLCGDISQRQQKVLVFTQFREMTRPLAAHLERVFGRPGLTLDGQTPVKKRKGLVDTFQQEQGPPFMVISLKAGGTGLNLTAASHVIHFDRWWNPAVEDQATDRAHRIGQTRAVLVHKLICRGTVEERIDALIESKQAMARDLLGGGGEAVLTELSDQQLLGLVKLDLRAALEDE